ncbi:MAG: hypothetical protein ACFFA6_14830 [Promethearchaeota archaeon]
MSDIYVPIDYSEVKNVIPPGEDIVYSTLCKVTNNISSIGGSTTQKWISHVLITTKGVAFTIPQKKGPIELTYLFWYDIDKVFSRGFMLRPKFSITTQFLLTRDSNFESKESFKERHKLFKGKLLPIIVQALVDKEKEIEANPDGFAKDIKSKVKSKLAKYGKALSKIEKKVN